jgi:type I restriction enzyme M protein
MILKKIIKTYQFRTEEDRYSKRVSIEKIRDEHEYNLNISRYISTAKMEDEIKLDEVHETLEVLEKKIGVALSKHNEFLKELGLPLLPK